MDFPKSKVAMLMIVRFLKDVTLSCKAANTFRVLSCASSLRGQLSFPFGLKYLFTILLAHTLSHYGLAQNSGNVAWGETSEPLAGMGYILPYKVTIGSW